MLVKILNKILFSLANYTEDLLGMHEHQVEVMKSYYEQNKHMYKMVEKRATMFAKMEEYEVIFRVKTEKCPVFV